MNAVVAMLTLRQLLGRRRTLLLIGLGALMVLVAIVYRLGSPPAAEAASWTTNLIANFGIATLLPVVALIVGTGAFGAEIDEGTIVHLLAKPLRRWQIVATKLIVATCLIGALTAIPIAVAAVVAGGDEGATLAAGFGIGALVGSTAYAAIFVALGLLTSRAFIVGLAYVLVWEGFLGGLLAGTRTFSVRQHVLSVADAIANVTPVLGETIGLTTALVVSGGAFLVSSIIAVRRLGGFEIRGETA